MPLQCRHARVFRTFSGTFRVFLVCPQEWHSRPQASPHFHRGCARLWTRAVRPAAGWHRAGDIQGKAKGPRKYELQGPFC
jgi:hypothetical protein